jgi:uncharacterized membrane protein (UPF0127 family)
MSNCPNKVKRRIYLILALAIATLCPGCKQKDTDSLRVPARSVTEAHSGLTKLTAGNAMLWVEVVQSEEARARGLMYRKELPTDQGMLFVFDYPQHLSFWMKNTYIPLDIAFVAADGRILNILQMKPLDEGPRYESNGPAVYAIETNTGWFQKNGVKAGDKVKF